MAASGAAARPSRRFLVVSGAVLVVSIVVALLLTGGWAAMTKDPEPPDVWEREGSQGDLRLAPDGDPLTGWFLAGRNDSAPSTPGGKESHFLVLGIEGRQRPPLYREFIDNRFRKDPWKWSRERGDRNLTRVGEPVDTSSGRWWRYSTRWWSGAKPPGTLPR